MMIRWRNEKYPRFAASLRSINDAIKNHEATEETLLAVWQESNAALQEVYAEEMLVQAMHALAEKMLATAQKMLADHPEKSDDAFRERIPIIPGNFR
jgi:hypothetical protein